MNISQASLDNGSPNIDEVVRQIKSHHDFTQDTHCNLENAIWKIELALRIAQPILNSEDPLNISFNEDIAFLNLVDRLNRIIGEVDILLAKIDAGNEYVRKQAMPMMRDLEEQLTTLNAQIPLSIPKNTE